MNLIYNMPFEYFPFKEELFSKTLTRELQVSELRKKLRSSNVPAMRTIGNSMITPFTKVEDDINLHKIRKLFDGQVITNRMMYNYLNLFEKARCNIRSKPRPIFNVER